MEQEKVVLPRRSVARRISTLLTREGLRPQVIPNDGRFPDVKFKRGGDTYLVQLDEQDDDFFQLSAARSIPEPRPTVFTALRAAHQVQGGLKVVKIRVSPGLEFVEFQTSVFLGGHEPGPELLARCCGALQNAIREFGQALAQEQPTALA